MSACWPMRTLQSMLSFLPAIGSVLGLFLFPHAVVAQCVKTNGQGGNGNSVKFIGGGLPVMNYAIGKWTSCNQITTNFLKTEGSADRTVTIVIKNEHNPATCGVQAGNQITLWTTSETAAGTTYNCRKKDTLAHEMGHILGLDNSTGSCSGFMMAGPGPVQPCGDELCAPPRGNPKIDECYKVRDVWDVLPDPPVGDGEGDGGGDGDVDDCEEGGCSPIVIDVAGDGFRFTDADKGVDFDITRVDRLVWLAWTEPSRDDVFLVLDRDGNRTIDDGGELFGNFTDQPESSEPNGYNALALFDTVEFRGNEDGKIDEGDIVFAILEVWHDQNHNGVSESSELYTMQEVGVDAIYLDYWRSHERDEHGNELRYFGRVCLSARSDTYARQLAVRRSPLVDGEGARGVLDPMGLRDGSMSSVVRNTECEGTVVQSTDVFFVSNGWSDLRDR